MRARKCTLYIYQSLCLLGYIIKVKNEISLSLSQPAASSWLRAESACALILATRVVEVVAWVGAAETATARIAGMIARNCILK